MLHYSALCLFLATALALPVDSALAGSYHTDPIGGILALPPTGKFTTNQLTAEALLKIAPKASSCEGANGGDVPKECRTAQQALPHIHSSFTRYGITHPSVQAALVSLIAYETADFKYAINHWPGILGQGTRNMQSPNYNAMYAQSLGFGMEVTSDLQTMMDRLTQDEYAWGSAAWFVTTQCPVTVRQAMWNGGQDAWMAYVTGCVGTEASVERWEYWVRATSVLVADPSAA